jgi:uncharacterized protein YndB with AHSA1/START domain
MTNTTPAVAADAKGIDITRVFKADATTVFRAWTQPDHFSVWFGGRGADVPVEEIALDVRPGGTWRAKMYAGPERNEIDWHGEYREVSPPERLVFTLADRPGDQRELVTVVFRDLGDNQTEVVFRQDGGHMSEEQYAQAAEGWSTFFDVMDEVLADL